MPAAADPEEEILGVASNAGPGAVCAICQLSKAAQQFAVQARQSKFSYSDIAAALSEGMGRTISPKALWHHLNATCKGKSA